MFIFLHSSIFLNILLVLNICRFCNITTDFSVKRGHDLTTEMTTVANSHFRSRPMQVEATKGVNTPQTSLARLLLRSNQAHPLNPGVYSFGKSISTTAPIVSIDFFSHSRGGPDCISTAIPLHTVGNNHRATDVLYYDE
jgi:hypothetical protein